MGPWPTADGRHVIMMAMSDVTQLLTAIDRGDSQASSELLPLVYNELRRLAAHRLSQEKPGQTLEATALVHEAYLRLVGPGSDKQQWNNRSHFFAAAAEAMRRLLIESARRKQRIKHGGDRARVDLDEVCSVSDAPTDDLLALDEALTRLAAEAPAKADLVKLRYFAGLSLEDAAEAMKISPATAKRYWAYARAWLYNALKPSD
jgi:RNA polymerase sigma factor (TIGR02999 family)